MATLRSSALRKICAAAILVVAGFVPASQAALTWTTWYNQADAATDQLRAVDVSDQAGNDSVYVGMIQTTGNNRRVYQFSTDTPSTLLNSTLPADGNDQPKAIASDDRGNVYVGNRISGGVSGKITTRTATLGSPTDTTTNVPNEQFGGLAAVHFGGHYYLYASREATQANSAGVGAQIRRYIVDTPTSPTLDTSFGTSGVYTVPGTTAGAAETLRGIAVADDGTIFTTNRDTGTVYKISSDLSTVTTNTVAKAMDVALYDGNVYATSYNGINSLIRVFSEADLSAVSDITISTLDGNPYSRGSAEGWGGIDIDSTGRIWLGDENYASGPTADRLLVSSAVPEPATATLLTLGLAGMGLRRRRR